MTLSELVTQETPVSVFDSNFRTSSFCPFQEWNRQSKLGSHPKCYRTLEISYSHVSQVFMSTEAVSLALPHTSLNFNITKKFNKLACILDNRHKQRMSRLHKNPWRWRSQMLFLYPSKPSSHSDWRITIGRLENTGDIYFFTSMD